MQHAGVGGAAGILAPAMPQKRADQTISQRFSYYYVRLKTRGLDPFAQVIIVVLAAIVLCFSIAGVYRIATSTTCTPLPPGPSPEPNTETDRLTLLLGFGGLLAIYAIFKSFTWALRVSPRRVSWRRRIQGSLLWSAGSLIATLPVFSEFVADIALCNWKTSYPFFYIELLSIFFGLLLMVTGSVRANSAGWLGFLFVAVVDLYVVYALVVVPAAAADLSTRKLFVIGFCIHAIASFFALTWSYSVYRIPGSTRTERAKAGEAGRSLAALWVLLVAGLVAALAGFAPLSTFWGSLKGPIVAALTLGALLAIMGGAFTKYAEGHDSALTRRAHRLPSEAEQRIVRLAARMIAAAGPLSANDITTGVKRSLSQQPSDREVLAAITRARALVKKGTRWDLADPDTREVLRSCLKKSHR